MLIRNIFVPVFIVAAVLAAIAFVSSVRAETTATEATQTNNYQQFTFFTATTTTATSTNDTNGGLLQIKGAKKVELYFSRGDTKGSGNSGSTVFKVQVTPDGTNWYDFNKLRQNLATSTTPTVLSSVTVPAGTSTVLVSLDLQYDTFYGVRCIAVETTDGEHTCKGAVEY